MQGSEIFLPFVGMLTLTFVVWGVLYTRRIGYMRKHRINPQDMTTPEKGKALLPDYISYPAYNFANLFELPNSQCACFITRRRLFRLCGFAIPGRG